MKEKKTKRRDTRYTGGTQTENEQRQQTESESKSWRMKEINLRAAKQKDRQKDVDRKTIKWDNPFQLSALFANAFYLLIVP